MPSPLSPIQRSAKIRGTRRDFGGHEAYKAKCCLVFCISHACAGNKKTCAVWYFPVHSCCFPRKHAKYKITSAQGNKDLRIKLAAVTGQSSRKSCISIRPACGRAHERMAARQRGSARAQRPNSNLKPLASPLPDGLRHLPVESRDVMRQRWGECDGQSGTLNRPIFTSKKTFEESLFIFRGPRILTNPDRG